MSSSFYFCSVFCSVLACVLLLEKIMIFSILNNCGNILRQFGESMANIKKSKDEESKTVGIYLNAKLYRQYLLVLHSKNKSLSVYLNGIMEKQLASYRSANGIDPSVEITQELINEINLMDNNKKL